jgi:hypothetical protein
MPIRPQDIPVSRMCVVAPETRKPGSYLLEAIRLTPVHLVGCHRAEEFKLAGASEVAVMASADRPVNSITT